MFSVFESSVFAGLCLYGRFYCMLLLTNKKFVCFIIGSNKPILKSLCGVTGGFFGHNSQT